MTHARSSLFVAAMLCASVPAARAAAILPTRFDGDRIFVIPQTPDGRTLDLYTDTGGGLFIDERAALRLGLPTEAMPDAGRDPDTPSDAKRTKLPRFRHGFGIPAPLKNGGALRVMPAAEAQGNPVGGDGMLGEAWFGGYIWTFDYPRKRLTVESPAWKPYDKATRVALGFKSVNGRRETNFPRITIRVDGQPIDVLLDTGATTTLTPDALATLADGQPASRATSMIVDTQFQAWRKAHPEWRVIEKAQEKSNAAMIEVPDVEIAGSHVGPVWFTWRPDRNFHEFMSGMTDARVEGAIGGNALRHFEMTLDYPRASGWFRCARGCKATPRPAP